VEVEASQAEVNRWEEAKGTYRDHLESLSLGLHPFDLSDSTPHTSAQVESRLRDDRGGDPRLGCEVWLTVA
jgi:hypothetical protein